MNCLNHLEPLTPVFPELPDVPAPQFAPDEPLGTINS
jgi:hypothetical protein